MEERKIEGNGFEKNQISNFFALIIKRFNALRYMLESMESELREKGELGIFAFESTYDK